MENASKALLIAGGVLIALIILTSFIVMYGRIANLQEEQEEQIKLEQIAEFNAKYEAYNKRIMYGADVITLMNKVQDNNAKSSTDDYKISLVVTLLDDTEVSDVNILINDYQLSIFSCKKISYNNLGRVSKIEITQKSN